MNRKELKAKCKYLGDVAEAIEAAVRAQRVGAEVMGQDPLIALENIAAALREVSDTWSEQK